MRRNYSSTITGRPIHAADDVKWTHKEFESKFSEQPNVHYVFIGLAV